MEQEQFETIVGLLVEIRDSLTVKAEPNPFGQWTERWNQKSEVTEGIDSSDMLGQLDAAKEKLALLGELLGSFKMPTPTDECEGKDEE